MGTCSKCLCKAHLHMIQWVATKVTKTELPLFPAVQFSDQFPLHDDKMGPAATAIVPPAIIPLGDGIVGL